MLHGPWKVTKDQQFYFSLGLRKPTRGWGIKTVSIQRVQEWGTSHAILPGGWALPPRAASPALWCLNLRWRPSLHWLSRPGCTKGLDVLQVKWNTGSKRENILSTTHSRPYVEMRTGKKKRRRGGEREAEWRRSWWRSRRGNQGSLHSAGSTPDPDPGVSGALVLVTRTHCVLPPARWIHHWWFKKPEGIAFLIPKTTFRVLFLWMFSQMNLKCFCFKE